MLQFTVYISQYHAVIFHKYASGHGNIRCSPGHSRQQTYLRRNIFIVHIMDHKSRFHTWNFKAHIIWNIAGTERSSLPEQTGNLHTLRVVPSLRVVR